MQIKFIVLSIYCSILSASGTIIGESDMSPLTPSRDSSGFVNLSDIDPTILQSVRYATSENFTGQVITGYTCSNIIMTRECAQALKLAQALVTAQEYALVVYDAYRPIQAVNFFYHTWRIQPDDYDCHHKYYSGLTKDDLFTRGYIGKASTHSRGSTVDLTIIKQGDNIKPCQLIQNEIASGKTISYLDDGTVNMGSSFDIFNEASHHYSSLVTDRQTANRHILLKAMQQCGFKEYAQEWWHYILINEPFPDTYFDHPVKIL